MLFTIFNTVLFSLSLSGTGYLPLCPSQPQLVVEGRGEDVVSGDDLINFDSITTAMAASAQSQVTIATNTYCRSPRWVFLVRSQNVLN